jgi:MFS transporter, DHA2 family, multidrug resistance protein
VPLPAATSGTPAPSKVMLIGLGLATWMEFYTYDGVNLVLPDMAGTFGISQDQASWILTIYLSALLFGVPLSIWMAAHVGHLRYIIGATIVFAITSVGCATSPDFDTLLCWRALQGFAGAGLTMWWRASVYMLMPGPQRSGSLMRISVMLYLATSIGLLFCGYVTDTIGWRVIFLPNVVFAAISVRLLVRHFPTVSAPTDVRAKSVDKLGIMLLGIALVSLQVALSRGDIDGWLGSPSIQDLLWTSAIAVVLFVGWQISPRNSAPLLHLKLLHNRNLQAAVSLGLFAGVILSGSIYAMPEFLRNVYPTQLSATQTGRILCAYSLTAAAIRPLVTMAMGRFGQRKVIVFAFCMLILSMLLIARLMTTETPVSMFMIPLVLYAFCLAPMLSAIGGGTVSKVPGPQQLDAVSIYMTIRQLGASLGITLVTTLLDWRESFHSSELFAHVEASSATTQAWMNSVAQQIVSRGGYSTPSAHSMALQALSNVAAQQATTLAYADAFLFMAAIGAAALCFVPLMSPTPVVKK